MQESSTSRTSPESAVLRPGSRSSGPELDFDFVELSLEPALESESCCGGGCGTCFTCNAVCFGCVVERNRSSAGDGKGIESAPD